MLSSCPLCEARELEPFLERSAVPVFQNLPLPSQDEATAVTRGDLRLAICRRCGFVTNAAFDPERLRYGAGYENDQTHSGLFGAHVGGLLDRLARLGLDGSKTVVEVGCGQGNFLKQICARTGASGLGFDPAHTGPEREGGVRFVKAYYGSEYRGERADVVVCRHVIEHVPQPLSLLGAVREALRDWPGARVFFETPDVGWILRHTVLQDFFYEHCSYFTPSTLRFAFERAGFSVASIEAVFGEQYMWLEASPASASEAPPPPDGLLLEARAYGERVARRIASLTERVERWRRSGAVAVWGAGAKGTTFANLLDPERERIDCLIDINPRKRGRFVPGSGHPILGPEDLAGRGVGTIIVMNPNYTDEIRAEVAERHPRIEVVTESEA